MLDLATAVRIAGETLAEARRRELPPMTVAVLDHTGTTMALHREEGASLLRPDIAVAKAWGSLGMGRSSRAAAEIAAERPQVAAAFTALAGGRFVPTPGGVLVEDGDSTVGAVGVTGELPENDEACAIVGIEAVGLRARTD